MLLKILTMLLTMFCIGGTTLPVAVRAQTPTKTIHLAWDWDYPGETIAGFKVWKKRGTGAWVHVGTVAYPTLTISDTLTPGEATCYSVRAYRVVPEGLSDSSNILCVTIPGIPGNLRSAP